MIDATRRTLLKGSLGAGAIGVAVGAGLLTPGAVLAAWPEAAFKAEDQAAALNELLGADATETSDAVKIKAPDIAENGAVVPVTVDVSMDGVENIAFIVKENPSPLVATFSMGEGGVPFARTNIKMGKTSDVIAMVTAGGKTYMAKKEVKVTIGGCGG